MPRNYIRETVVKKNFKESKRDECYVRDSRSMVARMYNRVRENDHLNDDYAGIRNRRIVVTVAELNSDADPIRFETRTKSTRNVYEKSYASFDSTFRTLMGRA